MITDTETMVWIINQLSEGKISPQTFELLTGINTKESANGNKKRSGSIQKNQKRK